MHHRKKPLWYALMDWNQARLQISSINSNTARLSIPRHQEIIRVRSISIEQHQANTMPQCRTGAGAGCRYLNGVNVSIRDHIKHIFGPNKRRNPGRATLDCRSSSRERDAPRRHRVFAFLLQAGGAIVRRFQLFYNTNKLKTIA